MSEPSRSSARLRPVIAVTLALAATVGIVALTRDSERRGGSDSRPSPAGRVPARVRALVERMTLAEKVDGVLVLGFDGIDATAPMVSTARRRQLGGILVGRRNWRDPDQGAFVIGELRLAGRAGARIPPLIVAAQEAGPYRSFPQLEPAERQLDIGDGGSARSAFRWARGWGRALRAIGVDMNLAPIVDIATLDSPIADRAFGDDPAVVAEMSAAAIRGCRAARLICTARHFPGLGAASQDTAEGPATVSLPAPSLHQRDLAAFRAAFSARAPAVMLSHAFYAAYDPVTPGSLSSRIATGLLRRRLRFRGVALTDDLGAGAITAGRSPGEAAVAALRAGADMLLISEPGRDQRAARSALIGAARSGELPRGRLDQAIGRVLEMKRRAGLLRARGRS